MIYFNNPYLTKNDKLNVLKSIETNHLISDGNFYNKTCSKIKTIINAKNFYLTQSGSSALEVASLLLSFKNNDEIILPSYTFSSTANSILLANGKPVFVDINENDLCINLQKAEKMITKNTKAIYVVHYGGNSCDMDYAIYLKKKYNVYIVEDAAHAFLARYKNKYCGTIGDIGIFSFHQTKNFTSGQGGGLVINNKKFVERSEIILNKGNTRNLSKENYYLWKDVGSEYKMNEMAAALLYNQILKYKKILNIRKKNFSFLEKEISLIKNKCFKIVTENRYSDFGYHILALVFNSKLTANKFKNFMLNKKIQVMSHYFPLHKSKFGSQFKSDKCNITENIYSKLIRLPIHCAIKKNHLIKISKSINDFMRKKDK